MQKFLTHISSNTEYQSFIRALHNNCSDSLQLMSVVTHGNLFEIYHQTKFDYILLPIHEYTQEFHDFITEYHKHTKIILFVNNYVDTKDIFKFWTQLGLVTVGKEFYFKDIIEDDTLSIRYHKLYDDFIFKPTNVTRNDKTAVMLSSDNKNNSVLLDSVLYPSSLEKLVLFNSNTYNHPQNVGLLNLADANLVLNTYKYLIDIDDNFTTEAQICNIPSLSTDGNIIENINQKNTKPLLSNVDQLSYNYFVKHSLIPKIIRKI
jgi:hypothetical protein